MADLQTLVFWTVWDLVTLWMLRRHIKAVKNESQTKLYSEKPGFLPYLQLDVFDNNLITRKRLLLLGSSDTGYFKCLIYH